MSCVIRITANTGTIINYVQEYKHMSKEKKSRRDDKKKPLLTPKEKKAAKRDKKQNKDISPIKTKQSLSVKKKTIK